MTLIQLITILNLFSPNAEIEMLSDDNKHYSDPPLEVCEVEDYPGLFYIVIKPDLSF